MSAIIIHLFCFESEVKLLRKFDDMFMSFTAGTVINIESLVFFF